MKRILVPVVLALVLVGALGASSAVSAPTSVSTATRAATKSLTINVRLIQEATFRTNTPQGLRLSTTLHLFAIGEQLGFPPNTFLGSMSFSYILVGSCSASTQGCNGSLSNLITVTHFPGGTISAGGTHIKIGNGLNVPITKGTGIFKGVTGTIVVAPKFAAQSIYQLTLPS